MTGRFPANKDGKPSALIREMQLILLREAGIFQIKVWINMSRQRQLNVVTEQKNYVGQSSCIGKVKKFSDHRLIINFTFTFGIQS